MANMDFDWQEAQEQWLEAQRKYWNEWAEASTKGFTPNGQANPFDFTKGFPNAFGAGMPGADMWETAMKQWWGAFGGQQEDAAAAGVQDFCQRLVDAGQTYFKMAEKFAGAAGDDPDAIGRVVTEWLDNLQRYYNMVDVELRNADPEKHMREGMAFWDLPNDTWQRAFSSLFPVPGDFFRALRPDDISTVSGLHGKLDQFLSVPAVGYTRESQEQYQKLARRYLEYQKASYDFNVGLHKEGVRSVELFQARLKELTEKGESITSVREIYNLWVDACEDAYAEYALSESYAELYGNLVNSLMAVKRQIARITEETLEAWNVPTRSEVNTLHKRLQEMRRAYRKVQQQLDDERDGKSKADKSAGDDAAKLGKELSDVKGEMEALRKEVAALKAEAAKPAASKTEAKAEPKPTEDKPTKSAAATAKAKPSKTETRAKAAKGKSAKGGKKK